MKYKELVPVVNEILTQYDFPLTVRQIYYRLISDPYNLFANTRSCYTSFDRMLVKAREEEKIDEDKIEDRTRQVIGGEQDIYERTPEKYLKDRIEGLSDCWMWYNLKMWSSQQNFVEVWVEKDALASVVNQAAKPYRVLIFPSRGFSSYTKIKEAILRLSINSKMDIVDKNFYLKSKPTYVLHLADHDPSGLDMTRDLTDRFDKYGGSFIKVKRIALSIDQVKQFHLRPNPVKKADSRSFEYVKKYGEDCWELDALPPDEFQKLIKANIENFIDKEAWEQREREIRDNKELIRVRVKEIMKLIRDEE